MKKKLICAALALSANTAFASDQPDCLILDASSRPQSTLEACDIYLTRKDLSKTERSDALTQRGVALRNLGKLEASLSDLQAALELDPENTAHLRMLAWTHRELGQYKKAERAYTKVLRTDEHPQGWLSRCVVRIDLKKYKKAAADCEQAILRDPGNLDALYFGAMAFNYLGQGIRAYPLADKAMQMAPEDPRHYGELAWALYLSGEAEQAVKHAMTSLKKFPSDQTHANFIQQVSN